MANRVLSIEIGNSSTQIVEVDYKTKTHKVYDAVRLRNPKDIISDGMINVTEDYVQLLRTRLAEQRIKTRDCIFSIASTRIAAREVQIPNVKRNRVLGIIKANAQDYFPVDLEQYEIGFYMLGNGEAGEDGKLRVMALAVPKTLLDSYYKLAKLCGLNIVSFDYNSNSIYQILKNQCGDDVTMVLKIDEFSTNAIILNNGEIAMQRNVSYGVEEAITIVGNSKLFGNINYSSAVPVLRTRQCFNKTIHPDDLEWSLTTDEEDDTEVDDRMKALMSKVTASVEPMINNIGRVIDYYNSRNSEFPIKNVYITGIGGDFKGLTKLMTNALEIKVLPLSRLEAITFGKSMRDSSFGEFISCLGAVIDPIGLVDKNKQDVKGVTVVRGTNYTAVGILVLCLGVVVGAVLAFVSIARYNTAVEENRTLNAEIATYSEAQRVYDTYLKVLGQNTKYNALYYTTMTNNENLVEFLNELEQVLPASFYTDSFSSSASGISMTAQVDSMPAAARLIMNIRDMDVIDRVQVSSVSDTVDELGEEKVTFSFTAEYKPVPFPGTEQQTQ